jgi:hypothetical protein
MPTIIVAYLRNLGYTYKFLERLNFQTTIKDKT